MCSSMNHSLPGLLLAYASMVLTMVGICIWNNPLTLIGGLFLMLSEFDHRICHIANVPGRVCSAVDACINLVRRSIRHFHLCLTSVVRHVTYIVQLPRNTIGRFQHQTQVLYQHMCQFPQVLKSVFLWIVERQEKPIKRTRKAKKHDKEPPCPFNSYAKGTRQGPKWTRGDEADCEESGSESLDGTLSASETDIPKFGTCCALRFRAKLESDFISCEYEDK